MPYTLDELNQMSQAAFVAALGDVFEQTPAIAHAVWSQRPFSSVDHLHQAMMAVVHHFSPDEQLALIRAHPDLGSKAAMAQESVEEQASVGLDQLSPTEYERFHALNQQYHRQFDFPFIIAVKHHTKASILDAFENRLHHSLVEEMAQAIAEISEIARLRLHGKVTLLSETAHPTPGAGR